MKIALVSPLMEAVPPKTYGGTERVVANLADMLSAKGHQVTVFANAESRVNGDLVVCRDRSLLTDERLTEGIADHIMMLDRVRQMADRFDLIHFHTELLHFPIFEDMADKTLTTCHSRIDQVGLAQFFQRYRRFPLVSISDAQRRPLPKANWIATVPHGYPLDRFRYLPKQVVDGDGRYLAFLGRISPEKGIDAAIKIARAAGLKLKIAARINPHDRNYWDHVIEPQVDGKQIEYVGEITDTQKVGFMNGATAFLFPIRWPEPFGLVMIEAMACGTPVIAFPCGAVREVIDDGVSGRIVKTIDEAVSAVPEVRRLDRKAIRARFEQRFSSDRMADAYLDVYRRIIASSATPDIRRAVERRLTGKRGPSGRPPKLIRPYDPRPRRPSLPEDC